MSKQFFSENDAYKFLTVEQYFANYRDWEKLREVKSQAFNADLKTLTLDFRKSDGNPWQYAHTVPPKGYFPVALQSRKNCPGLSRRK